MSLPCFFVDDGNFQFLADCRPEVVYRSDQEGQQSFNRPMRPPPSTTRSLNAIDLEQNPSYFQLKNSNTAASTAALIEEDDGQRTLEKSADWLVKRSREDLMGLDDIYDGEDTFTLSYEETSYVTMHGSETESTLQSSGAYESML